MKILSLLLILGSVTSITFKIVDEDYLIVKVGNPQKELKLLIDPTAPFSYIFTNTNSKTAQKHEKGQFKNIYGSFEGQWESDYFYFEHGFNFLLKYVKVEKTSSHFKEDGVLALGYSSQYPESNIYLILSQMDNVFDFEPVLSYDKVKSELILGHIPDPDYSNPVSFPLFEGKSEPGSFVKITGINIVKVPSKETETIELNDIAKLGIMPVIIAPKERAQWITDVYLPKIQGNSSKSNKETDPEKFFSDVYFTEKREHMRTEMVFNDTAYAYDFCETSNGKLRSNIKIGDDSNNPMNVWYIGIDLLFVQRADFDYGKGTVKLYSSKAYHPSSNKLLYLATMILYSIIVGVALGFILRSCCAKKKQKEIKKGEELLEL